MVRNMRAYGVLLYIIMHVFDWNTVLFSWMLKNPWNVAEMLTVPNNIYWCINELTGVKPKNVFKNEKQLMS